MTFKISDSWDVNISKIKTASAMLSLWEENLHRNSNSWLFSNLTDIVFEEQMLIVFLGRTKNDLKQFQSAVIRVKNVIVSPSGPLEGQSWTDRRGPHNNESFVAISDQYRKMESFQFETKQKVNCDTAEIQLSFKRLKRPADGLSVESGLERSLDGWFIQLEWCRTIVFSRSGANSIKAVIGI
jgi:hypothetical protein